MARMNTARLAATPQLAARLAWQARRRLRLTGAWAVGGAACAVLALLAQWHASQLAAQQVQLQQQLRRAVAAAAHPTVSRSAPPSTQDSVAAFYTWLPAHDTIPDLLMELVSIADHSGITLAKAEYKPEAEAGVGFLRYRITLPVKASFPKVQDFIIHALQTLPALTLESVSFKREQIDSGEVEARMQFVLLVRVEERR